MATLDTKKIGAALKALETAAKAAVKVLNDASDSNYANTPYEKHPLQHIGHIGVFLQQLQNEALANVPYEGMTEEQKAEAKAAEREAELIKLQELTQAKLVEYTTVPEPEIEEPQPDADSEPTGNEDTNPDSDVDKEIE